MLGDDMRTESKNNSLHGDFAVLDCEAVEDELVSDDFTNLIGWM